MQGSTLFSSIAVTLIPVYQQFHFLQFHLPTFNCGLKILDGKFQKQFINFKPQAILSSVMKSLGVPLHPTQDVTQPFVHHILPVCTTPQTWESLSSCLGYQINCHGIALFEFK